MHEMPQIADKRILRPAQSALALELVNKMDLLRIKSIARIYARGLPPKGVWEDMLQEALTRVLIGSRRPPEGVPMVAFVAGILRSLRADYWRRAKRDYCTDKARIDDQRDECRGLDVADPTPGQERALSAKQQIALIRSLFADDPAALAIIDGLGNGLTAEQIRVSMGLSKTAYHSARRRMRRRVLREGLTCAPRP